MKSVVLWACLLAVSTMNASCSVPSMNQLQNPRWYPFVQNCDRFRFAQFSDDNGSMVFLMYPDAVDAASYFSAVNEIARKDQWTRISSAEAQLQRRPTWVLEQENWILKKLKSENSVREYYSQPLYSDPTLEVVEVTYLVDEKAVLFAAHYLQER